jgi:hypothetical protein
VVATAAADVEAIGRRRRQEVFLGRVRHGASGRACLLAARVPAKEARREGDAGEKARPTSVESPVAAVGRGGCCLGSRMSLSSSSSSAVGASERESFFFLGWEGEMG